MDTIVVAHEQAEVIFTSDGEVTFSHAIAPYRFVSMMARWTRDEAIRQQLSTGLQLAGIGTDVVTAATDDYECYASLECAQIGTAIFRALYPVYAELYPYEVFSDGFYGSFPISHSRFIEAVYQKTLRDLILTGFGYYRKDLVRAIVKSNADDRYSLNSRRLSAAMLAAPYLPADWIVAFLNEEDGVRFDSSMGAVIDRPENLNIVFAEMSRYDIRRILWGNDYYHLNDICDMAATVDMSDVVVPAKPTATALHDAMVKVSEGLMREDLTFVIPDTMKELALLEVNGVPGRPLATTREYAAAGDYMDNCAGGYEYALRAKDGQGFVLLWDTGIPETSVIAEFRVEKRMAVQVDNGLTRLITDEDKGVYWFTQQIMHGHNGIVDDTITASIKNRLASLERVGS